ncbi:hypothetical protein LCGC14_2849210 [marine sediment metagenome]|uniref:ABC transporter permease n=1 Tax=marine sediment metagenome TaxID=412755 RepID=A0A0F9AH96_9ZZZZ
MAFNKLFRCQTHLLGLAGNHMRRKCDRGGAVDHAGARARARRADGGGAHRRGDGGGLGTMRVTEQIDALRAMGADPIRVLVVPRFLACVLLIPILVLYANAMGILGGYVVSVYIYGLNESEFWRNAQTAVENFDVYYGPLKSIFFGAVMSLVCCYKGFRCAPGAAGVGRACTQSFVASCMSILALNFFLGMLLNTIYEVVYGTRPLL